MMGMAIALLILMGLVWLANRYERHIRVYAKRYEEKIRLTPDEARQIIGACELLMEIHPDPQSDEYRNARDLKLRLERSL